MSQNDAGERANNVYCALGDRIGWGNPNGLDDAQKAFYIAVYAINSIDGDGVLDAFYNDRYLMQNAAWAFTYLGMTDIAELMRKIDLVYQINREEIDRYCDMKGLDELTEEQKAFQKVLLGKKLFYEIENIFYDHTKQHNPYVYLDLIATERCFS